MREWQGRQPESAAPGGCRGAAASGNSGCVSARQNLYSHCCAVIPVPLVEALYPVKKPVVLFSLTAASFLPAVARLAGSGLAEPVGLLSDLALGGLVFCLALAAPAWLRVVLVLLWALFQATAVELFAAMQRLPTWQDLHYLADAEFMRASTAGLKLARPVFVGLQLLAALALCVLPARLVRPPLLGRGLLVLLAVLLVQGPVSRHFDEQPVAARYNPLHWFVEDALLSLLREEPGPMGVEALPPTLRALDLDGDRLIGAGRAKNVLIVVLEGATGLYHPEIRRAMGVGLESFDMSELARATARGMLIPDFTVHSHQTIRGLYAALCGDFSKLSWDTPKAFELLADPARAEQCLPARLADQGWSTHFLQGAGLQFMGKDKVMPAIGFGEVHGSEWFTEPNPFPFEWGASDEVFFRGARQYVKRLQDGKKPWLLTLLTVGTHQPYAVPDALAARYPSRKIATVAEMDRTVAAFIDGLRRDGVLEDTLVIVTSDESHGSDLADWVSSWGLGIVLAPEQEQLPRVKNGGYGLVDLSASVLDYLGLDIPAATVGRSLFRDYQTARDMVSYTGSKLRWVTADGLRYECTDNGSCRVGAAASILGNAPADFHRDRQGGGALIFPIARTLDNRLTAGQATRTLQFASGELRSLPEKVTNEWNDNLIGAQYLDFPARSTVHVSVRVKAVRAAAEGINLNLRIKQWEIDTNDIPFANFPVLHAGDEGRVEFSFYNVKRRQSFSFFLVGEGRDAQVRLDDFSIRVDRRSV